MSYNTISAAGKSLIATADAAGARTVIDAASNQNVVDALDYTDDQILAARIKPGLARTSASVIQLGVPDTQFFGAALTAYSANVVRYIPIVVRHAVTLTAWQQEITTGPASAANMRVGIYAADQYSQPSGAPVYDSGAVAVASAFTGLKAASLSVVLTPGVYLVAHICDVAMTFRTALSPAPAVAVGMGASLIASVLAASATYGAFPNPGTAWSSMLPAGNVTGLNHTVFFQWTE